MNLTTRRAMSGFKKSDTILLFMVEQEDGKRNRAIPGGLSFLADGIDLSSFKGKSAEAIFIPLAGKPAVIICGLGKGDEIDAESLRRSASVAVGLCRDRSVAGVSVLLPEIKGLDGAIILESIAEGLFLSNYNFNKYKTGKNENGKSLIKEGGIPYRREKSGFNTEEGRDRIAQHASLPRPHQ